MQYKFVVRARTMVWQYGSDIPNVFWTLLLLIGLQNINYAIALWLVLLPLTSSSQADLIVQTENGKVKGTVIETPSGKTFYSWKGIPYGKPPIKKLRFLPPLKADPWKDIFDASKDSPSCIYFGSYPTDLPPTYGQSEDCLYLNVYSPNAVGTNTTVIPMLSVMFWIYGGGFFTGNAEFAFYDPTPLLEENVIVVTMNYRLGALGFLSTEDDVILGNAGIKDQHLALQWVGDNIAAFGGNPQDVTLFGESAGAISVGYHLINPQSKGLFKAAIIQSGSVFMNVLQKDPRKFAYRLASQVNPSITNQSTSTQVRDVLQSADANLLVTLSNGTLVRPVIEVKSNLSILSDPLFELIEAGNFIKVPIIIGHNSEEAIAFVSTELPVLKRLAQEADLNPELLVLDIHLKANASALKVGKEIHKEYVGKHGQFTDDLSKYLKWFSDNKYGRNLHKQAVLQSKFTTVYMYEFSYCGTLCQTIPEVPGAGRVGHATELPYLFNISHNILKTEEELLTRKRFVKLWTNFAKKSNPTPDEDSTDLLQNIKWEPINKNNIQYLDINKDLQIKPSQRLKLAHFWDHIWKTYCYRPYNTF